MNQKEYYPGALAELLAGMRAMDSHRAQPYRMSMGGGAYRRLRAVCDRQEPPGLPGTRGAVPRSMLILTGLPVDLREDWPSNLWAVIDTNGNAIQAGVLDDLPEESPDGAEG